MLAQTTMLSGFRAALEAISLAPRCRARSHAWPFSSASPACRRRPAVLWAGSPGACRLYITAAARPHAAKGRLAAEQACAARRTAQHRLLHASARPAAIRTAAPETKLRSFSFPALLLLIPGALAALALLTAAAAPAVLATDFGAVAALKLLNANLSGQRHMFDVPFMFKLSR